VVLTLGEGHAVISMWLHVLGSSVAVIGGVVVYLVERGPIIGSRWLSFLRDLRRFLKGD
jgi:hypothetical protein